MAGSGTISRYSDVIADRLPYWHSLKTPDVARVVARDPVVVLPLAAIEQHGPHLPLSTDLDIGMGLLMRAASLLPDGFPWFVLPPQAVGTSDEHLGFPGTLSLSAALLSEVLQQHGTALRACGVRRLVISNSHGGNRHAIDQAALALRRQHGMLVVKAHYYRFPRPADVGLPDAEWRHGLHAGAVETAMMMHLRPDLVDAPSDDPAISLGEELEAALHHLGPEGTASFAWLAGDLHSTGAVGNPRLADPERGRLLVAHYGKILAEVIRDARTFPLERLV
jgi:creatinine amidohydrolase